MIPADSDPTPEVEIDEALVRSLLQDQHADLADGSIRFVDRGWDNVTYRLGDELAVRLPTRWLAAPLAEHEHRWLPELGPRLPLPTPVPVRLGRSALGYPWSWSVVAWFPGRPALLDPPADPDRTADQLAEFLTALATDAPPDAPPNPYRGVPLADRRADTEARIDALDPDLGIDRDELRACWRHHVALPRWTGSPQWLHGDIHPLNLIVHRGELAAVIDFGDLTSGDPATDLFIAWMLLPPRARERLRHGISHLDDAGWERARGWALCMALAYLSNPARENTLQPLGLATVATVLGEWRP